MSAKVTKNYILERPLLAAVVRTAVVLLLTTVFFAVGKLLFMLINARLYAGVGAGDVCRVVAHGLSMDLSVAAYLTAIPGLLMACALVRGSRGTIDAIVKWYLFVVSLVIALTICLDAVTYGSWQFKLDVTPFCYFASSPTAAFASVSVWFVVLGFAGWGVASWSVWTIYKAAVLRLCPEVRPAGGWLAGVMVVITGLLFILMRGGLTVSTMNLSRAYHSPDMRLNHAAVNPLFSLLYSAAHQTDFGSQYRFFEADEAARIFEQTRPQGVSERRKLLKSDNPDIYILILESFSAHLMPSLGGENIATGLDSIARSGLMWDRFYASSFRTDRGIPAVLSAYPGQPNTSVIKFVDKAETLPSLARELAEGKGYDAKYYYGGDINFTNQLAYLVSGGFDHVVSDKDFDISERLSKWGAHDGVVLARAAKELRPYDAEHPRLTVIQTSSSHEPWDVPGNVRGDLVNERARAFAYADSCITTFVNTLRDSGSWDNTLVVLVPDHYGGYPELTDEVARHHIPLVMTGGALALHGIEHGVGSQVDIAPTLVSALGLDAGKFAFGRDLLDSASPGIAYFADPSYIGWITDRDTLIFNLDTSTALRGDASSARVAKAYLQTIYDDLDRR